MSRRIVMPVALSMMLGILSGCSTTDEKGFLLGNLSKLSRKPKSDVDPTYAAAKKNLDHPERAFLRYAEWKADIGQVAEARRSYENVLSGNPTSIDALLGLARVEKKAGRTAEAEKKYLQVLALNPSSGRVLHAIGQFYAYEKRSDDAINMLGKAVAEEPTNPTYRFNLGVALTKAGQIDEGLSHLSLTVGEAEANYNIGYLLNEMGQSQDALPYLKNAISLKPSLKPAHDLLAGIQFAGNVAPNIVNAVPTQVPFQTASRPNYRPAITPGQPQQQVQQFQAANSQQIQQVTMQSAPVMPPIPTTPSTATNNGYRPPQPASVAVPLLPPQQSPAMPQAGNDATQRLPGLNVPNRRQINSAIQQASATHAAPASSGLTPAQLQQLLQATK